MKERKTEKSAKGKQKKIETCGFLIMIIYCEKQEEKKEKEVVKLKRIAGPQRRTKFSSLTKQRKRDTV